ncbi:uncharacterized protein LOC123541720 [Mercenaria mercenaria]|uniref:uncharacterized protein LOC123541720 n=1 Tax=Mercenaria mercenaria TaxID=6596 RepID=UPI00234F195E|nr:uncharacterized protein LOC123541720 [Mercenaria mercenaria]
MEMTEGNGNQESINHPIAGEVHGRTAANVTLEHLDHTNTAEQLEVGGRTADNLNRERPEERKTFKQRILTLFRKRICKFVIATVTTLFFFALAVIIYVLVSLKKEGKNIEIGHCPKYSTNGTVVKTTGSSYGDTIELTCNEKSKLNGPSVITCLSTGNWSGFSQCIPKLCNNFPLSDNMMAESEIENISVGTTVTVNCEEGFVLTGKNTVVCLTNEQWSENPTCKAIDCETPESVANAVITNISETAYNSIFFVECKKGFIMSGNNTVKCNLDGNWDSMPICKPVTCGIPTIPGNGSISQISGTSFQATASLKCNKGFFIIGDPIINCLSNGMWSDIPTCQDIDDCIPGVCGSHGICVDGVDSYSCSCKSGFSGSHCERTTDCFDILQGKITQDGVYTIITWNSLRHIQVYCDMTTDGGGWTVFQNRFDGSVEFYRNFSEYEIGFGRLNGEFWLGLENLYELVSQGRSELRLDVSAANGTKGYVTFQNFKISSGPNYTLHISPGHGTIGDNAQTGMSFNNNAAFSTFDHDVDTYSGNCAGHWTGAWWYTSCMFVHLNGQYCTPGTTSCHWSGMVYKEFMGYESLLTSRMMFRRV